MRLRYKLCRCECEMDDLVREETGHFVSFILPAFKPPFALLTPIRFPYLLGPFLPSLHRLDLSARLQVASDPFPLHLFLPEIASDALIPAKPCLQSHRRILALGLTKRYIDHHYREIIYCFLSFCFSFSASSLFSSCLGQAQLPTIVRTYYHSPFLIVPLSFSLSLSPYIYFLP